MTRTTTEDANFLRRCGHWPHWPYCPVVRYKNKTGNKIPNGPEHGVVRDIEPIGGASNGKCEPIVRILNIFTGWDKEKFNNAKAYEYASIEEMLADGWYVD